VTLAGVAPDLDGLGAIPEILTRHWAHPLDWFSEYHHVLGHNLGFGRDLSSALAVRRGGRARAGRGPVADSVSFALFAGVAMDLAGTVGAQRVAEFYDYGRGSGADVHSGLVAWILAPGDDFAACGRGVRAGLARALRHAAARLKKVVPSRASRS